MPSFIREKVAKDEYAVEFTVEGSGEFPVDMLRYDACYPATEALDVPAIAASYANESNLPRKRRVVLRVKPLMGEKHVNLTPDRWASFGWRFIGIGELRDEHRWPAYTSASGHFHRA